MMNIQAAAGTSAGAARDSNEDLYLVQAPGDERLADQKGWLLIVADGMGGHAAGGLAARIVVDTLARSYLPANDPDTGGALRRAFAAANAAVRAHAARDPKTEGMGATCVAAVLRAGSLTVAHAGDCRAYIFRDGCLRRLTADHTLVAELLREKAINEDQAVRHPYRHIVNRAVGIQPLLDVDVSTLELQSGDMVLLCSDGLSGAVRDEALAAILREHEDLEGTVRRLINRAVQTDGRDNVTLVLARAD